MKPSNLIGRENRLLFRRATDFGYTNTTAAKNANRQAIKKEETRRETVRTNVQKQRQAVTDFNMEADANGSPFRRERTATTKDQYNQGRLPVALTKNGKTVGVKYSSQEQKRTAERGRAEGNIVSTYADKINKWRELGGDSTELEAERDRALQSLYAKDATKDTANASFRGARAAARAGLTGGRNQPGQSFPKQPVKARLPFGNRTSQEGQAANTRAARLGLEPGARPTSGPVKQTSIPMPPSPKTMPAKNTGKTVPPVAPTGTAPVVVPPADIPTSAFDSVTNRSREAAGALDGDSLDTPASMAGLVDEEMAAADPMLYAQSQIRDGFKIYSKKADGLLNIRGKQIEDYKNESHDRAEQVADAKIAQSKDNRDLEVEIIDEARDRGRRDVYLEEDKMELDYEREEDRIISENADRIERMETSLGGRYGGFGSGKGMKKIQGARDEGSKVLRELTEDRIYARKESVNKLMAIEDSWKLERKEVFRRHDENVTEAFTKLVEQAQAIDDNALIEEGDQIDSAVKLAREGFDALDKIWTKIGDDLSAANQRALTRRDTLRTEDYKKRQDAYANIFSGLANLPSNSPLFTQLEREAGLTPGSIAATTSNEGRRIAISEGALRIQQGELSLQISKFERDGKQIDTATSKELGYLVTSTGEVFRDYFGNPVNLVSEGGSITSNIGNDSKLYGESSVGIGSTVNFSRYALAIGDLVPGSPYHKGGEYDIDGKSGQPIPVWNSGTVTKVNNDPNDAYGIYVDVFDGTNTTRYAHLQAANVQEGMYINGTNSGQASIVGIMGNTGNVLGMNGLPPAHDDHETGSHLHLEVRSGNNFATGQLLDPMNVGMLPGQMHSGNVVWVDEMRKKLRMGGPIGSAVGGGTIKSNLDTPWAAIDEEIIAVAEQTFRTPSGGVDYKALEIVHDYLLRNKMGDYSLSIDRSGSLGQMQTTQTEQASFRADLAKRLRERIAAGEDPTDLYDATIEAGKTTFNGKEYPVDEETALAIFEEAGYTYDKDWFNEMVPIE